MDKAANTNSALLFGLFNKVIITSLPNQGCTSLVIEMGGDSPEKFNNLSRSEIVLGIGRLNLSKTCQESGSRSTITKPIVSLGICLVILRERCVNV